MHQDIPNKIKTVQRQLIGEELDGWLLYDYRRSNSLAWKFLEIPNETMATRRFFYWIPQKGEPIKIVSAIESFLLDHLPGVKWVYKSWQDLERHLFFILIENRKIAMEYSHQNALPNISKVDAGTIELIRRGGGEVFSSANLLQRYTSVLSDAQLESHLFASKVLEETVDMTWGYIENSLRNRISIDEYQVQQFMLKNIQDRGCITADWPTCAVNAHSADPHYHPTQETAHPIVIGDFILLDVWCKQKIPGAVYADITRVGIACRTPSERHTEIFNIVKGARDLATAFIEERFLKHFPICGWEVDQVCRTYIQDKGFGERFIHRTGHNIGEEVHGPGANLDNLETHDDRFLLTGTLFSIEPGIYLPGEFGVRLEYDVYLSPKGVVQITGGIQKELVCFKFLEL